MTTTNARKGAETERMVARALRDLGFPEADRRLREGRADDQGDIDGVPLTTVQVKYVAKPALNSWVKDTLKQRDEAGNPLCLLVVRKKYANANEWDTYMPLGQIYPEQIFGEESANGWIRMGLGLAAALLRRKITEIELSSPSSWDSTASRWKVPGAVEEWLSALSTERDTPPSPTT